MPNVLYEKDGRIARIILNRAEVMNVIDLEMPQVIEEAVQCADADPDVHVIVFSVAGPVFCAGYDIKSFAETEGSNRGVQDTPWDAMLDYRFKWANTQHFMSLWRAMKPVLCKVHGFAVAGSLT